MRTYDGTALHDAEKPPIMRISNIGVSNSGIVRYACSSKQTPIDSGNSSDRNPPVSVRAVGLRDTCLSSVKTDQPRVVQRAFCSLV